MCKFFFFSSRRRHTRLQGDWSSDVCSSDLGAAMGLLDSQAFDHLAGRVVFFAVPAEEYGDIEWRVTQARAGRLEFLGGKPELLRLGHLDDVDMAMMIHMTSRP